MKKMLLLIFGVSVVSYSQEKEINRKDVFDTARYGTVQEMELLAAINADTINSINKNGFTPLILSCYKENIKVSSYLIARVKNINHNSSNGTALAATVVRGNNDLAKMLLTHNADPNLADENGVTPLIYAIQFKNKAMVELLLKSKADKKQGDASGKKPFEYAVLTNDQEIINLIKN